MENAPAKPQRLASLDVLRGMDMFLLAVIGPLASALDAAFGLPPDVKAQFRHAWGGFTLWDAIMPLFIFMGGASVPFALSRRLENGRPGAKYWKHVLVRFAMLWILGMVAQGRLLSLDPLAMSPFDNTLQSIACGYLACAAVFPVRSFRVRIAFPLVLAAGYSAFLATCGDYTMDGSAAMRFERWFVPFVTPAGSRALELADPGYTWWATIPMFAAMGLCGMEAAIVLKNAALSHKAKALRLFASGAALLAAGFALSTVVPPVKHIFTVSFTAQAMGASVLLLAALYAILDARFAGSRAAAKATWIFTLFGKASLLAYMCEGAFKAPFRAFGQIFAPGFAHAFGKGAGPVAAWFASSALLVAVLMARTKLREARRTA